MEVEVEVEAQSSVEEHADHSPCLQTGKQEVPEPQSAQHHQAEVNNFPAVVDNFVFNLKQTPKDQPGALANKANVLISQTFSSLLSEQPVVMTQKPTAYVRPMDGQEQVVMESPELKPSPEFILKTGPDQEEMPLQYLEVGPQTLVSSFSHYMSATVPLAAVSLVLVRTV